jgi:hypothetical protein
MSKGWPIVGDGNRPPLYQTSEAPRQGLAGLASLPCATSTSNAALSFSNLLCRARSSPQARQTSSTPARHGPIAIIVRPIKNFSSAAKPPATPRRFPARLPPTRPVASHFGVDNRPLRSASRGVLGWHSGSRNYLFGRFLPALLRSQAGVHPHRPLCAGSSADLGNFRLQAPGIIKFSWADEALRRDTRYHTCLLGADIAAAARIPFPAPSALCRGCAHRRVAAERDNNTDLGP